MASNTIAIYFKVDPSFYQHDDLWKKLEAVAEKCLVSLGGQPTSVQLGGEWDRLLIYPGQNGSHLSMRLYSHGLITIDIHHYLNETYLEDSDFPYGMQSFIAASLERSQQLSEEYIRKLECDIKELLGDHNKEMNSVYVPIRRGMDVWPYAVTADERILEMDYDKEVSSNVSRWQKISIFHSREFGNVLFLDGDAMIGESDYIYTKTLCGLGELEYKDKEVLILGGGDGGVIHELLKEPLKFVLMAEIDEEVVKSCRKHMRSICGDSLDTYEGPRHKIVFEDCMKILHDSVRSGQLYDYVINDLTEFPVDKTAQGFGYDWQTTSMITELSLKALKPGGKVLARGNCWGAYEYRKKFEGDLVTLGCRFKRKDIFVPSFQESYCLYWIWKMADENGAQTNGHAMTNGSDAS